MWINRVPKIVDWTIMNEFEVFSAQELCLFAKYPPINWYHYMCIGNTVINTEYLEETNR